MADTVRAAIITTMPLRTVQAVSCLLDALERVPALMPTHWGLDERAREPYTRAAMETAVTALDDDYYVPGFVRRKPPRYQGYFSASNVGLKYVKIQFSAPRAKDLSDIFLLGEILAEQLKAEFGVVHPIWQEGEGGQWYSEAAVVDIEELQTCGPQAVAARTWFGPHMVRLVGRAILDRAGASVQDTSWGGVQLDLVESPWQAGFETLRDRQLAVMAALQPTGVFGDFATPFDCKAGPHWQPIPTPTMD